MRLVSTPIARQLTGLSADKIREWTSRRALVPADVRPKQKGSPAMFSWKTILILRLAVLLQSKFGLELEVHKTSLEALRKYLLNQSFIALWGKRLALDAEGAWHLLDGDAALPNSDLVLLLLDPHLRVLQHGFSLPGEDVSRQQLDLFALPNLRRDNQVNPLRRSKQFRTAAQ